MTDYETRSIALLERIAAALEAKAPAPRSTSAPAAHGGGGGMTLPNYGKSKGQPIAGAELSSLEYYATGARRSLADPAKERWHEKERALLAAIEAEIARQSGGGNEPPPPGDADMPMPF
jgi:hypothetical protein